MNQYDYVQLTNFLTKRYTDLESELHIFQNRVFTFKNMDEFDSVELHRIICTKNYLDSFEVEFLKLLDYLLKCNSG